MHRWRRWLVKQVSFFPIIFVFSSLYSRSLNIFNSTLPLLRSLSRSADFCKERVSEANQRQAKLLRDWFWCSPLHRDRSNRTTDLIEFLIRKKRFQAIALATRRTLEIPRLPFIRFFVGFQKFPNCSKRCLVFRFADHRYRSRLIMIRSRLTKFLEFNSPVLPFIIPPFI